jgi:T-complex protein 1 subunit alpha
LSYKRAELPSCKVSGELSPQLSFRVLVKAISARDLDIAQVTGAESLCIQVLVDNPAELEKIRDRESDITKERIQKILDAGANVVLTTKGIDDMSLKYFVEAGVIACRRVPKEDLRWVSKKQILLTHCIRAETCSV